MSKLRESRFNFKAALNEIKESIKDKGRDEVISAYKASIEKLDDSVKLL